MQRLDQRISDDKQIFYRPSYFESLLSTELQELENKPEETQIQTAITKNQINLVAVKKPVIQQHKISCHLCSPQKEILVKKFFYTFENGLVAFFCSEEEKKCSQPNAKRLVSNFPFHSTPP